MHQKFIALVVTVVFNTAFLSQYFTIPSTDTDLLIYGTVYTEDGESYTGQIRWGKEEAFWFDHFNSSKPENEHLDYLTDQELDQLEERNGMTLISWVKRKNSWSWSGNNDHTHQFVCEFGNIKSLTIGRRDRVQLELKNGDIIDLEGGSNDIKTYIQVTDEEIGHMKIEWDRIDRVEFFSANKNFENRYGAPLYGTVTIESGETFTGYVQWDHDERLGHDVLDGETSDGNLELEFENISKIEKDYGGVHVTTGSGREFRLRGTNDVDDGNRGIIVNIVGLGRVDIDWDEFEMVEFTAPKAGVVTYANYDHSSAIRGKVTTLKGDTYQGRLAYDLDETYQFEMLNGKQDDIQYSIPFHYIQSITPKRRGRAEVTLKSGKVIELEDSVDVSEDHDGILIFNDDNEPVYIAWDNVDTVQL